MIFTKFYHFLSCSYFLKFSSGTKISSVNTLQKSHKKVMDFRKLESWKTKTFQLVNRVQLVFWLTRNCRSGATLKNFCARTVWYSVPFVAKICFDSEQVLTRAPERAHFPHRVSSTYFRIKTTMVMIIWSNFLRENSNSDYWRTKKLAAHENIYHTVAQVKKSRNCMRNPVNDCVGFGPL